MEDFCYNQSARLIASEKDNVECAIWTSSSPIYYNNLDTWTGWKCKNP